MQEVGEHSAHQENVNLTKRFDLLATTEFVSVTSIEPMENFQDDEASLKLSFEESETSVSVPCTVDSSNTARSMPKKKTSFANNLKVVSIFSDNVATTEKPESVEFIDADRGEVDANLSEQMETVSISMESEYSEEDETAEPKSTEPAARLEQISVRIFATVLPDNETPEQRQCDLVQAQRRIHELTNGSLVLVVNCGEPNTQLVIVFNQVRNCPFDVDGHPDLATFVAFCERVYDWLLVRESHVLLLHAEGITARTRLLLLLRALASYYETSERYDPHTSEQLRAYIKNYPNGLIRSPVSWLRYSGYMRLFSPENCLSILRATLGIYKLFLHNMPVFEENKLRLFLKFYSGSPLRPVYTTKIHDFYSTNSCDVLIVFSNNADSQASNVGLRLQGDIVLFAYHCRPYPSRRLRLFRLHFHSCQGFFDPLTFQHDDFDELCDALPSTVRLKLHCTNRTTSDNSKFPLDTRVEHINLSDPFGKQLITSGNLHLRNCSPQQLNGTISPDEVVRLHDSLESIPRQGCAHKTRTVCFRSFENLDGTSLICNSHYPLSPFNRHSGPRSPVHALEPKPQVYDFLHYDSANMDMTFANCSQPNVNVTKSSMNQNSEFVQRKGLRATFSRVTDITHKPVEPNYDADSFDRSQLMPPPSSAQVPQSGHKRKRSMRQRFTELISGRRKVQHWDSETDSLGSAVFPITGSEYSVDTSSTDSGRGLLSKLRKAHAGLRGLTTAKLGPPQKSRKVVIINERNNEVTDSLPIYNHSEDLLEAARRLNFMAGTHELDRLLEELRLTSMQMTSGLPPVNTSHSPRPYTPYTQSSTQKHSQHGSLGHTQTRFHSTRSSSTIGLYGNQDYGTVHSYSGHPSTYTYQKHSSFQTEKRLDGLSRPAHYPTYRSNLSPAPTQRQHTTYTTVLKQRPPVVPKQFSQVHLTIDPECGTTETSNTSASLANAREVTSGREQLLESELNSARQELAQLRRAMSMVEERRRHETTHEYHRSPLSPVHLPTVRSSSVPHPYYQHHNQQQPIYHQKQQQNFMSHPSNSYHAQYHGSRSTAKLTTRCATAHRPSLNPTGSLLVLPPFSRSSTFQRGSPRQDGISRLSRTKGACAHGYTHTPIAHVYKGEQRGCTFDLGHSDGASQSTVIGFVTWGIVTLKNHQPCGVFCVTTTLCRVFAERSSGPGNCSPNHFKFALLQRDMLKEVLESNQKPRGRSLFRSASYAQRSAFTKTGHHPVLRRTEWNGDFSPVRGIFRSGDGQSSQHTLVIPVDCTNSSSVHVIKPVEIDSVQNGVQRVEHHPERGSVQPLHRKQNCHEARCSYCFAHISNSVHNCQLDVDSPSSTDADDRHSKSVPTIIRSRRVSESLAAGEKHSIPIHFHQFVSSKQTNNRSVRKVSDSLEISKGQDIFVPIQADNKPLPKPRKLSLRLMQSRFRNHTDTGDESAGTSHARSSSNSPSVSVNSDQMFTSPSRSHAGSTSLRGAIERNELFTQMEPLFPQFAELHQGPESHFAEVEQVTRSTVSTVESTESQAVSCRRRQISASDLNQNVAVNSLFPNEDKSFKPEVIRTHPTTITTKQNAPSIEVTFEKPVRTTSAASLQSKHDSGSSKVTADHLENSAQVDHQGVENVQLMKATGQTSAQVAYLPRSDGSGDRQSGVRSPIPRPQSATRYPPGSTYGTNGTTTV
ncbi:hypothetical protein PHET_01860 [Paragonimus heterotremus]|uniref:C2 tensin-type domain-containing protein n=1 Tax=Paragonimus heterotremus TaxID=100268 RepID=A0A8J4WJ25_9TREM|nr:hypothetical protein PHET_01860 [Paragonimus heterotremus]